MKRTLSFLLALTLVFSMIPNVFATEDIPSIDYDDLIKTDFTYTVANEEATITGYTGAGGDITIPSTLGGYPVTAIGDKAFASNDTLTSVIIPNGVTSIGMQAFIYCSKLTSVTIPGSITAFGTSAFYYCSGLTSVTIQDGATTIGAGAFYSCDKLASVTIPASVTSIGNFAFESCGSLTGIWVDENNPNYSSDDKGVLFDKNKTMLIQAPGGLSGEYTIPDSVVTINESAFSHCNNLTAVVIPDSVTTVGNSAFHSSNGLTSVTIPGSVTTIGKQAFFDCNGLTDVTLENGVTTIGEEVFQYCENLTTVTIPASVTSIGWQAFVDCDSLSDVYYTGSEEQWSEITIGSGNSCLTDANIHFVDDPENPDYTYSVENDEATILGYAGTGGDITIPSTLGGYPVTAIGDEAFYSCELMTSVSIPDSVTTIGGRAFRWCTGLLSISIPASVKTIGESAFAVCSRLDGIWVDAENPNYCSDAQGVLFNKEKTTLMQAPGMISGSYSIPDSVTAICSDAFRNCTGLTDVTIGNSVATIGSFAFTECTSLTSVTIPVSLTTIGDAAFDCCTALTDVYYGGTEQQWHAIGFGSYNDTLHSGTIHFAPEPEAPDVADYNYTVENGEATITGYLGSGGDITIPATLGGSPVIAIGEKAFDGITSLTSVTIPDSVTSIGAYAFRECINLTYVNIPDSVTDIANYVFYGCTSLTGIGVDENNTAFCSDNSGVLFDKEKKTLLQAPGGLSGTYTIPIGVTTISGTAFYSCANLTGVTIPNSVTAIGTKAFMRCRSLSSVVIPNSVTTVGESAFYSCSNLLSATISNKMNTIGRTVFAYCSSLKEVIIPEGLTHINKDAFYDCSGLTDVFFKGTQAQWAALTVSTGNDALSNAEIHYNYGKFAIITQPATQNNKLGDTATFTVEAVGAASYQWQRIKVGATNWSDISGATDASYCVKVSSSTVIPYRCVLTDAEGNQLITNEVTIILPDPLVNIQNQAGNQHIVKNTIISYTVELDSEEGVTYQWQRCKSGNNWTNVSYTGNKTKTVTFTATSWAQYPFRCEITDANGTKIYTDNYTYTLYEPPVVPNITSNPKDVYLLAGQTATFTVTAVGSSFVDDGSADTGVTYQWWRSKNGGQTWGEYTGTGSTTSSISLKVYSGQEFLYMCEVKDGYGNTMKSKTAQPHLVTTVKITAQPTITVANSKATITFTASGDVKTYQWQRLKNGTWSDAVGSNYVGYNTATLTTTVKATWRCRITDMLGNVTYTGEITFAG